MPSKSARQHRLMALAAHPEGRKWARKQGVKIPPQKVAEEFLRADQALGGHYKERKPSPGSSRRKRYRMRTATPAGPIGANCGGPTSTRN
jgi:hypothetical protein